MELPEKGADTETPKEEDLVPVMTLGLEALEEVFGTVMVLTESHLLAQDLEMIEKDLQTDADPA